MICFVTDALQVHGFATVFYHGLRPCNFERVNYVMVQCSVSFISKSNWDLLKILILLKIMLYFSVGKNGNLKEGMWNYGHFFLNVENLGSLK